MARKLIASAAIILVLAVAYFFLYGPAGPGDAGQIHKTNQLEKVKIGYQALSGSWVFYVANEQLPGRELSFFEEEGLDVEAERYESSNSAAEAMLRGEIVTDSATTMTVLLNIEERAPGSLKCFGFQMHTEDEFLESFIAGTNSGISGYADLAGKKIGVFPGSLNYAITQLLLKDHLNLETANVEIVRMPPPVQIQALTLGEVDALISYEPTTSIALKNGVANVIEDSPWAKRIYAPFPVATYCFTTDYLRKNLETANKITRAWFKAIDYIRTNRHEASATIPKYTNIEPDIAIGLRQPAQRKSTEVDREAINRLVGLYEDFGVISESVDVSDIYFEPSSK